MSYQVGIDLGTTYTAAAVHRDEKASIFSLGGRAAAIPSVVLLREDETILTGEAAVRRAITEPERVAREFKRRLGDTTPIIVGGSPYSAEALMARLLRAVLDEVTTREGGAPSRIAVSHPANWGPYKLDLFRQALRLAGLDQDSVVTLTEPEAAAISYANQERVEEGQIVAVYDLGGGTFDACVLQRTHEGFDIIGKPEGIERLGGIDFDAAVFAHVARSLDNALSELDPDDPNAMAAVSRLRNDCVDAKEALSSDTDATIPVLLPNLQTEVRLTRREFESVVRPSLADSIEAMRRAVASAGIEMDQVAKVLLVGGSSRIPLVAQMVASDLGRPVAVDAHPKHAIALGAAYAAAAAGGDAQGPTGRAAAPVADNSRPATPPAPVPPLEAAPPLSIPTPRPAPKAEPQPEPTPQPVAPPVSQSIPEPTTPEPVAEAPAPPATEPPRKPMGVPSAADSQPVPRPEPRPEPQVQREPSEGVTAPVGNRTPMLLGLAAVVLIAAIGGYFVLKGGGDDGDTAAGAETTTSAPGDEATTTSAPDAEETTTTAAPETNADAETQAAAEAVIAAAGVADFVSVEVVDGIATLSGEIDRSTNTEVRAAMKKDADVKAFGSDDALTVLEDDEWCGPTVRANDRYACITSAIWNGSELEVLYDTENNNEPFNVNGSYHYHVFPSETPVANSGVIAEGAESQGSIAGNPGWEVHGDPAGYVSSLFGKVGKICIRIATPQHAIESLTSGNCWPVTDES
ncbi:MAG: Hsp70 family protein [Acidimicrobiales bacterium]